MKEICRRSNSVIFSKPEYHIICERYPSGTQCCMYDPTQYTLSGCSLTYNSDPNCRTRCKSVYVDPTFWDRLIKDPEIAMIEMMI